MRFSATLNCGYRASVSSTTHWNCFSEYSPMPPFTDTSTPQIWLNMSCTSSPLSIPEPSLSRSLNTPAMSFAER